MNDFIKLMGQFGMEGLGIETDSPVSLEQEMNEEIAMEAELDEAYGQMEFANIVASTSQCEAILTAMAEREVGLESNAGRDAATIYKEFGLENVGMEAVKDVAMRKVYSGWASIKALINTCINWLKQLIGIHTASKKVFAGIKKKAENMRKQLSKVQSKVSDKLVKDLADFGTAASDVISRYSNMIGEAKTIKSIDKSATLASLKNMATVGNTSTDTNNWINANKTAIEEMTKSLEDVKDSYDPKDTEEYEGTKCFAKIREDLLKIANAANANKGDDMQKIYDKNIKALEKLRKDIDKEEKDSRKPNAAQLSYDPNRAHKLISSDIALYTKQSQVAKAYLKLFVRIADDCLTVAKGVYATLV